MPVEVASIPDAQLCRRTRWQHDGIMTKEPYERGTWNDILACQKDLQMRDSYKGDFKRAAFEGFAVSSTIRRGGARTRNFRQAAAFSVTVRRPLAHPPHHCIDEGQKSPRLSLNGVPGGHGKSKDSSQTFSITATPRWPYTVIALSIIRTKHVEWK